MSRFLLTSLLFLAVLYSPQASAAPDLHYSTMVEDSTYYRDTFTYFMNSGQFAADADNEGNLYVGAPISESSHELPEGVQRAIRIYKLNADGSSIKILTDIYGNVICYRLIAGETGIFVHTGTAYDPKVIKIDMHGNILFTVDTYVFSPIFVDRQECLYILAIIDSTEINIDIDQIPVTADAIDPSYNGGDDILLQKYSPDGDLLYSSFLGGSEDDIATDITIDEYGIIYLAGNVISSDFPFPIQGQGNTDPCLITITPDLHDVNVYFTDYNILYNMFIHNNAIYTFSTRVKKNSITGETIWSMSLNGELPEITWPWPTSEKPASYVNNTVIKSFMDQQGLIYSVHFKSIEAPFTTTADALYPNPHHDDVDLGIWQFTEDTELLYGTYFGGSKIEETTRNAVAFRDGKLYVAGYTNSSDFPLTPGAYIDTREHQYPTFGLFAFCIDFSDQPVAVDDAAVPAPLILDPPHPNPFNPQTTISFTLPEAGFSRLAVYDISGQLVRELTAEALPAGRHEIVWDGRDATGATVGSGLYIARLTAGEHVAVRKVTLVR